MPYRIENPATGTVEETFEFATDKEISSAITAGDESFIDWASRPMADRGAILERLATLLEQRAPQLAAIASREMGKPHVEAIGEVDYSARIVRYYATEGERLTQDQELKNVDGTKAVLQRRPIGLLLGIMPWNYPYYQVARFAAPNLMLGNTVLLKHAEICPGSALAILELMREAGVPADVYQNLFATHEQVSTIIADPRVQGISLTGSERAGSKVAEQAGRHLKKVVLELGGSDPYVVLSTDDIEAAAETAWSARMANSGQSCVSNKRIIVMDTIYDEFVDALSNRARSLSPADPMDVTPTGFSPLSSRGAADLLIGQVEDAVAHGATVVTGGTRENRPGYYVRPAVITGITPAARAYREELFGPVAMVYKVSSEKEAIDLANDSDYGLGGSVFSTDEVQAERVAQQLNVGMAHVNAYHTAGADLPFGGVKRSGYGRELGPLGMDEFVNKRLFTLNTPV